MEKYKYYFAYGSNLNLWQMRHRCPTAEVVGTASLDGYRLAFATPVERDRYGVLTVFREEGHSVPIGVWRITESDEKHLDRYEGFPHLYRKETMTLKVNTAKGPKICDGIIYIMNEPVWVTEPTLTYSETCMDGYSDFRFNFEPLISAFELADMEVII